MEKPIIATTLSGLFLKSDPWNKAHEIWFATMAKKLGDSSVSKWSKRYDYFKGVDEIMTRLYPSLSEVEKTKKARELFFDSVCQYVQLHPEVRNDKIIAYFETLKKTYSLALITTNTSDALTKILSASGLENLFDITSTSFSDEKDDKKVIFERFVKKYGKPLVYLGGNKKDSFDYCKKKKIPCLFVNLEKEIDLENVISVYNLRSIKQQLSKLNIG
jgi:phosphoglycolate phosphatase-like HAD superfamily hydrolase